MKVRGRRRCTDCGHEWSYYQTGSVECPACGGIRSVGVEETRRLHTDRTVDLDLTDARAAVDGRPIRDAASEAADVARRYVVARGFVRGGDLLPLDDVVVAAAELRHAADRVRRSLDPSEDLERYFLALLASADEGERPPSDEVPESAHDVRGLAATTVVEAYCGDLVEWLDEHPDPAAREVLATLREHTRRVDALDGDVPPREADRLVAAARDLGDYLRFGDEAALAASRDRLDRAG